MASGTEPTQAEPLIYWAKSYSESFDHNETEIIQPKTDIILGFHSSSPTKYSDKQYPDIKLFLRLTEGIIPLLWP